MAPLTAAPLTAAPFPPSRPPPRRPAGDDAVIERPGGLPAAAGSFQDRRAASSARSTRPGRSPAPVFALTLLSAVDGSLLALAAAGQLETLGGALVVGLLVIAGAGSWLAANAAFGGPPRVGRDWAVLAALGVLTLASTVAAAWLGSSLAQAVTLHVLPKAAGLVAILLAAEVAGLRLPRLGRLPLPLVALVGGAMLEVAAWTA